MAGRSGCSCAQAQRDPAKADAASFTFHSQSTYVLPRPGRPGEFIYMGDRWKPEDAIDGRYVWLPITLEGEWFRIDWRDAWRPDERAGRVGPSHGG